MTPGDIIVLSVLGLTVGAIVGYLWRNRHKGCRGGCGGCTRNCPGKRY